MNDLNGQVDTSPDPAPARWLLYPKPWLLFLGFPWAITASLCILMLSIMLRRKRITVAAQPRDASRRHGALPTNRPTPRLEGGKEV